MALTTEQLVRLARLRAGGADGTLRARRQALNLRLDDLASPAGISVPALSRWERGAQIPSTAEALAYAELLDRLERELGLVGAA